ncbi:RDD family protein [Ureibacillus chungkukjangi]|uniref:Putative RDD family membrane protein YckC n=1 Tax=Ureibacillus chungkukjangi TaxID=1202712 RepID=A0A318TWL0_9BACL|nr:RDD family protein [Ureibacillus chungkukjangi]PYF08300.1 putative RDD family membrane protein YckC [Ureibacillus chungkukjangi]
MQNLAGFWRRLGADILDTVIVIGLIWIVFNLIFGFDYSSDIINNITSGLYVIYATLLPIYWKGYIIGKRVMKIHIERIDENPINFWTMIKREVIGKQLLAYVSLGIAPILSAFMVGTREDKRAIHDFIAGTHVLRDEL